MSNDQVRLSIRVVEFGTDNVADVLIRVVDNKKLVAILRSNPASISLPPGNYAVYVSGDNYDTALRAFDLLPEREFALELPVYPVGTMPPPPSTIRDMPVCRGGMDAAGALKAMGVSLDRSVVSEEVIDGPAYVDYRNPDGFVFTARVNLEKARAMKFSLGTVPVIVLADCGNNTWRAIGSPR